MHYFQIAKCFLSRQGGKDKQSETNINKPTRISGSNIDRYVTEKYIPWYIATRVEIRRTRRKDCGTNDGRWNTAKHSQLKKFGAMPNGCPPPCKERKLLASFMTLNERESLYPGNEFEVSDIDDVMFAPAKRAAHELLRLLYSWPKPKLSQSFYAAPCSLCYSF